MGNRYAKIVIDESILTSFFTPGELSGDYKCVQGLPKNATFCHIFYDITSDKFCIVYSSPDFPELKEGEFIPVLHIMYQETKR